MLAREKSTQLLPVAEKSSQPQLVTGISSQSLLGTDKSRQPVLGTEKSSQSVIATEKSSQSVLATEKSGEGTGRKARTKKNGDVASAKKIKASKKEKSAKKQLPPGTAGPDEMEDSSEKLLGTQQIGDADTIEFMVRNQAIFKISTDVIFRSLILLQRFLRERRLPLFSEFLIQRQMWKSPQ